MGRHRKGDNPLDRVAQSGPVGTVRQASRRITVLEARIKLDRALPQILRFVAVFVGGRKPLARLSLTSACLQLRLGSLALRSGYLLLRGGTLRIGPSPALTCFG